MQEQNVSCCSPVNEEINVHQNVKDFYDSVAAGSSPYSDNVNKFSPTAPTEWIINFVQCSNKDRILDIGCGMGTTLLNIAKNYTKGSQFIGIDFSEKMIERAKIESKLLLPDLKNKVGFFSANAQSLPYLDGQFDFIYSECVFNLLPNRQKALFEIERVLSPNGILIYTDFVAYQEVPEAIRSNITLLSGCRAGSITLSENFKALEECGFVDFECVNFTADKNKRYLELMNSSPFIKQKYEELDEDSSEFLEKQIGYYLFLARKK